MRRLIPPLAALNGLAGIAFAAIGAHALHAPAARASVASASTVQMVHALAALVAPLLVAGRGGVAVSALFALGATLFGGAVSVHALGGPSLGPVAPVGGVLLMAGWLALAAMLAARRSGR